MQHGFGRWACLLDGGECPFPETRLRTRWIGGIGDRSTRIVDGGGKETFADDALKVCPGCELLSDIAAL